MLPEFTIGKIAPRINSINFGMWKREKPHQEKCKQGNLCGDMCTAAHSVYPLAIVKLLCVLVAKAVK